MTLRDALAHSRSAAASEKQAPYPLIDGKPGQGISKESRYWQKLAVNTPCELRIQHIWLPIAMEDPHCSFGRADGQAHVEAEMVPTIDKVLQP